MYGVKRKEFSKPVYWVIIILTLLTWFYVYELQFYPRSWSQQLQLERFPLVIGRWQGREVGFKIDYYDEERFGKLVGTQYLMREYISDKGDRLNLYIGYFNYRKGSEHHNPDTCFASQGWQISDRETVVFGTPVKQAVSMRISKGLDKARVFFWFQIKNGTMVNKWKHQIYLVKQGLLRDKADGVVVRITVYLSAKYGKEDILALQREFAEHVFELLPEYLPR